MSATKQRWLITYQYRRPGREWTTANAVLTISPANWLAEQMHRCHVNELDHETQILFAMHISDVEYKALAVVL